jgi:hypothetical protein
MLIHFIILFEGSMRMKVYVYHNGFIMSGKAWEIRQKLREYSRDYVLVKDLRKAQAPCSAPTSAGGPADEVVF